MVLQLRQEGHVESTQWIRRSCVSTRSESVGNAKWPAGSKFSGGEAITESASGAKGKKRDKHRGKKEKTIYDVTGTQKCVTGKLRPHIGYPAYMRHRVRRVCYTIRNSPF